MSFKPSVICIWQWGVDPDTLSWQYTGTETVQEGSWNKQIDVLDIKMDQTTVKRTQMYKPS